MNIESRIHKLEAVLRKFKNRLELEQKRRLSLGLTIFVLLISSQIFIGYALEWLALLILLPFFTYYLTRTRRYKKFILSLEGLLEFYRRQLRFKTGQIEESTPPEKMDRPDLARDLDLGILFSQFNYCFSVQGENSLNQWLSQSFQTKMSATEVQKKLKEMIPYSGLLRRIQCPVTSIKTDLNAIQQEMDRSFLPTSLHWKWLVPIAWLSIIFSALLTTLFFVKLFILIYIASMLAYISQTKFVFSRLQDIAQDLQLLTDKILLLERLGQNLSFTPTINNQSITQDIRRLNRLISLMSIKTNPILFYVLNMLLPWDFLLTELSEKARKNFSQNFRDWSLECSLLDVLGAFANLKIYHDTAWAEEVPSPFIETKQLIHPLLDRKNVIANDFSTDDNKVIVITGSNMSGKSTFLRALGVNFCLANIGSPVFATSFRFRPCQIISCIRVSDSLRDGQSYFYAEVLRMKSILKSAQTEPILFLIDEPLRGTNNKERLLGNQKYLQKILTTPACGFLSTHDLELTQLADSQKQISNYHFSESWENQDLYFDYKIKDGPSKSTNALKILALEGLYD